MSDSMTDKLDGVHPRMVRVEGEPDPQRLGKRAIGLALERALERSNLTKQEAAFAIGYSDSGVIGRWISGTETPQFAKLWMLGARFQQEFVIALAEIANVGVEVETNIRIRRTA